jgi:hypothetical protein
MDMDLNHLYGPSSDAASVAVLFWMTWPIVTFTF